MRSLTPRKALELLTASMPPPQPTDVAGWSPEDLSLYSRAREAFISGGARAVENLSGFDQSLQVVVETTPKPDAFEDSLRRHLNKWMREKRFADFFFMRKAPGLRLRFFGRNLSPFGEILYSFLEKERRRKTIVGHSPSIYEGETYQFGGEAGLALMHSHGTYDSLWALEVCRRKSDRTILSLLALNDLFRKVVLDAFEGWDIWENMRLAGRVVEVHGDARVIAELDEGATAHRDLLRATWFEPAKVLAKISAADRRLMREYFARNTAWARKYERAKGDLLYGIRQILPFYVIFHWNRLRLNVDEQLTLTHYMRRALSPKV